jgi:hypothetical protein
MINSKNIGSLLLIAASIGIIFAAASSSSKVMPSAHARSDYCQQFPDDPACQKDSSRYLDPVYKCQDQAAKDGVITAKEQEKCGSKFS